MKSSSPSQTRCAIGQISCFVWLLFVGSQSAWAVPLTEAQDAPDNVPGLRSIDLNKVEIGAKVEIGGTITYYDPIQRILFVQDGPHAVFIESNHPGKLQAGKYVRIAGTVQAGDLQRIVVADSITPLNAGTIPNAAVVEIADLQFGQFDARLVEVKGTVVQARVQSEKTDLFLETSGREKIVFKASIRHKSSTNVEAAGQFRNRSVIGLPDSESLGNSDLPLLNGLNLIGKQIRLTGCLGLFFSERDFLEQRPPGERSLEGFHVYSNFPASLRIVADGNNRNQRTDAAARVVSLQELASDSFTGGPFISHGQVLLVNCATDPREVVLSDQADSVRTSIRFSEAIEPGMVLRIGGTKARSSDGRPKFTTNYTQEVNFMTLLPPATVSFAECIADFKADQRVTIHCRPQQLILNEANRQAYLKVSDPSGQIKKTVDVRFQANAKAALKFAAPEFADTISISGVMSPNLSRPDSQSSYEIVVINADDVKLIKKKADTWKMVLGGLIGLLGALLFGFLWSKAINLVVDRRTKDVRGVAAQLRYSYDAIDDGVLVIGRNGTVLAANDEFRRLTLSQLTFGNPVGDLPEYLSHRISDPEGFARQWERWLKDPNLTSEFELQITQPEHTDVVVHSAPVKVVDDPEATNRIMMWRDETERRQLQADLLQSSKLEAVGRLVGSVAHDFNNVLTAIAGNLNVARMQPDAQVLHVDRQLEVAEDAAFRGAEQIRKLLTYSSRTEYRLVPTSINKVIANLHQLVQRTFGTAISFVQELDESDPVVNIDSSAIEQVLLNLYVNAKDAMPSGGQIRIRTRMVDEPDHQKFVLVSVEDQGKGVPEELVDQIFEPYFTTKPNHHGNGLGLSTSFRVVEQHGGILRYRKRNQVGSNFEFLLPQATSGADEPKPNETVAETLTGKILVVDDEEPIRNVTQSILRRHGFLTIGAVGGKAAIAILKEQADDIDLVLLDLTMPDMNGREVLAVTRDRWPETPVVLCSGFMIAESFRDNDYCRPTATISKPYNAAELIQVISESMSPSALR